MHILPFRTQRMLVLYKLIHPQFLVGLVLLDLKFYVYVL
jgi:hypothetical protein